VRTCEIIGASFFSSSILVETNGEARIVSHDASRKFFIGLIDVVLVQQVDVEDTCCKQEFSVIFNFNVDIQLPIAGLKKVLLSKITELVMSFGSQDNLVFKHYSAALCIPVFKAVST